MYRLGKKWFLLKYTEEASKSNSILHLKLVFNGNSIFETSPWRPIASQELRTIFDKIRAFCITDIKMKMYCCNLDESLCRVILERFPIQRNDFFSIIPNRLFSWRSSKPEVLWSSNYVFVNVLWLITHSQCGSRYCLSYDATILLNPLRDRPQRWRKLIQPSGKRKSLIYTKPGCEANQKIVQNLRISVFISFC